MKRTELPLTFISVILGIFSINFVSAQFYGGFGLSSILNSIDPSTMILGLIFIVAFALLNYSLSRVFRDNKTIGVIIAFSLSIGIIYAINLTGLDFQGFFYGIGFSSGILYTIIPFLLIGGAIYLVIKFDFGTMLAIVGGFLFLIGLTDLVYEKGFVITIGLILFFIGIWIKRKKKPSINNNIGNGIIKTSKWIAPKAKVAGKWAGQQTWKGAKLVGQKTIGGLDYTQQKAQQKWQERQRRKIQEKIVILEKAKQEWINYVNKLLKTIPGGRIPNKNDPKYQGWRKATSEVTRIDKELDRLRK